MRVASRMASGRRLGPTLKRIAVVTAMVALVGGCAPLGPSGSGLGGERTTDAREVGDGGTLQVALASDPDRLDPSRSSTLVARQVFYSMCEKLFDLDEGLNIVPQLAAGDAITSPDGMTVTIKLRTGVKFADGTDFDAAAVKTSLERHFTMKNSARKSELTNVASVAAPDPTTVVLTMKRPDAALTSVLADRAGMIMSPKALAEQGDDFAQNPVCVGAFKFSERVPGDRIVLDRDPNYYAADRVHVDKVIYRIITDGSVRLANLRSRDVQLGDQMAPVDVATMGGESSLQLFNSGSFGYQGIYFNVGNVAGSSEDAGKVDGPVANDKRLRQAFSLAIDRELLNKIAFQDMHQPACGPIANGTELSDPATETCPPRDLEKAKQLIAETGVPTPIPLQLTIPNTPESSRIGQVVQAMTAEAGFEVKLNPMEFASSLDAAEAGQFQSLAAGWSGRIDPDGNIARFVRTKAGNNYSGYSNPEVDSLLRQGTSTLDPAARRDIYAKLDAIIADEVPVTYLYRQSNLVVASNQVSGIKVYRDGLIRVTEAGYLK